MIFKTLKEQFIPGQYSLPLNRAIHKMHGDFSAWIE